jgi:hypothetical protein
MSDESWRFQIHQARQKVDDSNSSAPGFPPGLALPGYIDRKAREEQFPNIFR